MRVLLLDNNVLVHLIEELYYDDNQSFYKVLSQLALEYREFWIPKTVQNEFLRGRHKKKLARRLQRLKKMDLPVIKICPVPVARHETQVLVKSRDKDIGEAEAILQMTKARDHEKYGHHEFVFCSRDKQALQLAEKMQLEILPYGILKNRMMEVGIKIPWHSKYRSGA